MDKTIQVPSRFFYCLPHLIVTVKVKHVGNEVHRILVVLDFRVQASQVETVGQVFLVDFAKVLVTPRRDELYDIQQISGCCAPGRTIDATETGKKWKKEK